METPIPLKFAHLSSATVQSQSKCSENLEYGSTDHEAWKSVSKDLKLALNFYPTLGVHLHSPKLLPGEQLIISHYTTIAMRFRI